ncbi:hypothetical protein ACHQM5_028950 [Ranunculus cassubicifolius]
MAKSNDHVSAFPKLSSPSISATAKAVANSTEAIPALPTKPKQTVEHIVLFKMKEGYKDYETFIDAMNSLKCLPGVLYLSSGYIKDIHHPTDGFNVFLHSRHATKEHLDKYMGHRLKYAFTMTYTEPYYQDYQIIDYVHEHDSPIVHPAKGTALRTVFYKLKDGWGPSDKEKAIKVAKEHLPGAIDQQTFGDSYEGTTYRAAHKGYQVGVLGLFPGVADLKRLKSPKEFAKELERKLQGTLVPEGGVIVVDYEVKVAYDGNRDNLI